MSPLPARMAVLAAAQLALCAVATANAATFHVNAGSGSDANAGTPSKPFKTIGKAFSVTGSGDTVMLQNGSFTPASEGLSGSEIFTGRTAPAGVIVKAVNAGAATIGFTLQFPSGGTVTGVSFDTSSAGRLLAVGGTLKLVRPQWVKLGTGTLGYGIEASGNAKVTLAPGTASGHNYVAGNGLTGLASLNDAAQLTVTGGTIDGSTGQSNLVTLDGTARLTLTDFAISNTSAAWVGGGGVIYAGGTANRVTLNRTTIDLAGAPAACILQDRQTTGSVTAQMRITLTDSTLRNCNGGGIQLREGKPTLVVTRSEIRGSGRYALEAGQIGFDSGTLFAMPNVTISDSTLGGHWFGALTMNRGGTLTVTGSTLEGVTPGLTTLQLLGDARYTLKLASSDVAAAADGSAIQLEGNAASSFDLGTLEVAGENTIHGNGGGTGLRLSVAEDVHVQAVGNVWRASLQGANANGRYTANSPICSPSPCDLNAGSGPNFTFQGAGAGALLRLAP